MREAFFSVLETNVLQLINAGKSTYEDIFRGLGASETVLRETFELLFAKNIIILNTESGRYEYQTNVEGDVVVLDGNALLPTTILRHENDTIVTRGKWYHFPDEDGKPFDTRRIVWNVTIDERTNTTLSDLIRGHTIKEKKAKLVPIEEYKSLSNQRFKYNNTIDVLIHTVGEGVTDISLCFPINVSMGDLTSSSNKKFMVRSEVATDELLTTLKTPLTQRNCDSTLKLNRMFKFSDFVFSNNGIPIEMRDNGLYYAIITSNKKCYDLTFYLQSNTGETVRQEIETFDDIASVTLRIKELFGYALAVLDNANVLCDIDE